MSVRGLLYLILCMKSLAVPLPQIGGKGGADVVLMAPADIGRKILRTAYQPVPDTGIRSGKCRTVQPQFEDAVENSGVETVARANRADGLQLMGRIMPEAHPGSLQRHTAGTLGTNKTRAQFFHLFFYK